MAEEKYIVPANPEYSENIRKLQDSDPASATDTFNPLLQRLIENIHAVKLSRDRTGKAVERLETAMHGGPTLTGAANPGTETAGAVNQRYVNTSTGEEFVCTNAADGVYTWQPAESGQTMQAKLTGTPGQVVGFDADGHAVAQDAPEGGVTSFNGRKGAVVPMAGDYTAADVGALDAAAKGTENGVASLDESGKVPAAQLPSLTPFVAGTSAPADTTKLWIDTTPDTGGLKYWNGTAWAAVPVIWG